MGREGLISFAVSDIAKQVDVTKVSCESKIQAVANCFSVPCKWKTQRRLAQIWLVRRKRIGQSLNIFLVTRVEKVNIVRRASRTVYGRCNTTNNNELRTGAN